MAAHRFEALSTTLRNTTNGSFKFLSATAGDAKTVVQLKNHSTSITWCRFDSCFPHSSKPIQPWTSMIESEHLRWLWHSPHFGIHQTEKRCAENAIANSIRT